MLRNLIPTLTLVLAAVLLPGPAEAYIGPGSGVGLLGSLWAWLVGIFVVLLAILIWPLRWAWRRLRARRRQQAPAGE